MNWVFISQKTPFFIVTAVKTSNLTQPGHLKMEPARDSCMISLQSTIPINGQLFFAILKILMAISSNIAFSATILVGVDEHVDRAHPQRRHNVVCF
jgi:hypothetical protein